MRQMLAPSAHHAPRPTAPGLPIAGISRGQPALRLAGSLLCAFTPARMPLDKLRARPLTPARLVRAALGWGTAGRSYHRQEEQFHYSWAGARVDFLFFQSSIPTIASLVLPQKPINHLYLSTCVPINQHTPDLSTSSPSHSSLSLSLTLTSFNAVVRSFQISFIFPSPSHPILLVQFMLILHRFFVIHSSFFESKMPPICGVLSAWSRRGYLTPK
ncbi:hypothetical protein C8J57DRAFT_1516572 [Mycena rebaudengoi]|nr:hypothetical protein C8J57DRAFT_1516572 [Mycena rebaudengoi]